MFSLVSPIFYVNRNWPGSLPQDTHFKALMNQKRLARSTRSLKVLPAEVMINIFSYCNIKEVWTVCSLVNKTWKNISLCSDNLWITLFQKDDLSYIKDRYIKYHMVEKTIIDDITYTFLELNRFEIVCALFENFRWGTAETILAKAQSNALDTQNYPIAQRCTDLALYYERVNPSFSRHTGRIIKHNIKHNARRPNFLQISEKLINDAMSLKERDGQAGFKALITIAKRFTDFEHYTEAMELIRVCNTIIREPTYVFDGIGGEEAEFLGFMERFFELQKFDIAEECASYAGTTTDSLIYFSESREQRDAHAEFLFHLLKTENLDRARRQAEKIADQFYQYNQIMEKEQFKHRLKETGNTEFIALFDNLH